MTSGIRAGLLLLGPHPQTGGLHSRNEDSTAAIRDSTSHSLLEWSFATPVLAIIFTWSFLIISPTMNAVADGASVLTFLTVAGEAVTKLYKAALAIRNATKHLQGLLDTLNELLAILKHVSEFLRTTKTVLNASLDVNLKEHLQRCTARMGGMSRSCRTIIEARTAQSTARCSAESP